MMEPAILQIEQQLRQLLPSLSHVKKPPMMTLKVDGVIGLMEVLMLDEALMTKLMPIQEVIL